MHPQTRPEHVRPKPRPCFSGLVYPILQEAFPPRRRHKRVSIQGVKVCCWCRIQFPPKERLLLGPTSMELVVYDHDKCDMRNTSSRNRITCFVHLPRWGKCLGFMGSRAPDTLDPGFNCKAIYSCKISGLGSYAWDL